MAGFMDAETQKTFDDLADALENMTQSHKDERQVLLSAMRAICVRLDAIAELLLELKEATLEGNNGT